MPTQEKVAVVEDLKTRLHGAKAVVLTEYRGLTVQQVNELRRLARAPVITLGFVYPPADAVERLAAELRSAVAASRP